MSDYKEYLASLHAKLATPDEVLRSVVFEAAKNKLKNKRRIIAGEASEVYDVELADGRHIIVRIARGEEKQYEQEVWALEQARKVGGIPVPEVLLIKHLPQAGGFLSFCVQNKLPGEPLERGGIDFDLYSEARRRRIINKAGEILSRIHTIKTSGFGYLKAEGVASYDTFNERMSEHINQADQFLQLARKYEIPERDMQRALDILSKKTINAPDVTPILCHNDFNVKHIMVDEDDNITGIIDWGEVEGNTPVSEFAKWDYWFNDYVPTEWLKEGYSNKHLFTGDYKELFHWIRLDNGLGVMHWYDQTNYVPAVEKAKRNFLIDLEFYSG